MLQDTKKFDTNTRFMVEWSRRRPERWEQAVIVWVAGFSRWDYSPGFGGSQICLDSVWINEAESLRFKGHISVLKRCSNGFIQHS